MAALAERKPLAEEPDRHVVLAGAPIGGKRDLMRPLPIDRAFAQFASAIDHCAISMTVQVAARGAS